MTIVLFLIGLSLLLCAIAGFFMRTKIVSIIANPNYFTKNQLRLKRLTFAFGISFLGLIGAGITTLGLVSRNKAARFIIKMNEFRPYWLMTLVGLIALFLFLTTRALIRKKPEVFFFSYKHLRAKNGHIVANTIYAVFFIIAPVVIAIILAFFAIQFWTK